MGPAPASAPGCPLPEPVPVPPEAPPDRLGIADASALLPAAALVLDEHPPSAKRIQATTGAIDR